MRVAVFGSYNRQSVGDKAILVGLLKLLRDAAPGASVRVLAVDREAISTELRGYSWADGIEVASVTAPRRKARPQAGSSQEPERANLRQHGRRLLRLLPGPVASLTEFVHFQMGVRRDLAEDTDILIVGGGNLIMDLFKAWPWRLEAVVRQFHHRGAAIYFAGVGAYPPRSPLNRRRFGRMLRWASGVYARDRGSARVIEETWGLRAQVHPDFAFSLPAPRLSGQPSRSEVIVNVVPLGGPGWHSDDGELFERYTKAVSDALLAIPSAQGHCPEFRFVDTNYPTDRPGTLAVMARLREAGLPDDRLRYADTLLTCQEIQCLMARGVFAITTRLHAGILALSAGTPVIAIAYQPKVAEVLADRKGVQAIIGLDALHSLPQRAQETAMDPGTVEPLEHARHANRRLLASIVGGANPARPGP